MSKLIRPVLDLTISHKVFTHGEITIFLTWWLDAEGEAPWPCLVIAPTFKTMKHSYQPCVVSLDLAWIWDEERGDNEFAMQTAISFCESIGLTAHWENVHKIASAIRDHIGDLLSCPPRPSSESRVVADALLRDENGREVSKELSDVL